MNKIEVNTEAIQQFNPCQEGIDNWIAHYQQQTYDFLTFLNLPNIPARDKVWLAVRLLPRELVEVFAVDCAFEAVKYSESADAAYAAANADASYDYASYDASYDYAADYAYAAAAKSAYAAAADATTDADYAAAYAADAADAATTATASAAYDDAAADAERERQLDCLAYLYGEYYNNAAVD